MGADGRETSPDLMPRYTWSRHVELLVLFAFGLVDWILWLKIFILKQYSMRTSYYGGIITTAGNPYNLFSDKSSTAFGADFHVCKGAR